MNEEEQRRAAWQTIKQYGLEESWRTWVQFYPMPPITARVSAQKWACWAQEGLSDTLRTATDRIISQGRNVREPQIYLNRIMSNAQINQTTHQAFELQEQQTKQLRPDIRIGTRVTLRSGQRGTVTAQTQHDTTILLETMQLIDIPHTEWINRTEEPLTTRSAG